MDWRVPLADLDYGIEEESAVLSVLRSKWLTMGDLILVPKLIIYKSNCLI